MPPKKQFQNLRRVEESLSGEEIKILNEMQAGLGNKFHRILSQLGQAHAAQAGHKGPVGVAKQTKQDSLGREIPGLDLNSQRISGGMPGVNDDDFVTLGQIRQFLQCENLVTILENCVDDANFMSEIEDVDDQVDAAAGFIHSADIIPVSSANATLNLSADLVRYMAVDIKGSFRFSKISYSRGSAAGGVYQVGLGVYDRDVNLLVSGKITSSAVLEVKTVEVGTFDLAPGLHWLAILSDATANIGVFTAVGNALDIFNATGDLVRANGTVTASDAELPQTDTLVSSVNVNVPIVILHN